MRANLIHDVEMAPDPAPSVFGAKPLKVQLYLYLGRIVSDRGPAQILCCCTGEGVFLAGCERDEDRLEGEADSGNLSWDFQSKDRFKYDLALRSRDADLLITFHLRDSVRAEEAFHGEGWLDLQLGPAKKKALAVVLSCQRWVPAAAQHED